MSPISAARPIFNNNMAMADSTTDNTTTTSTFYEQSKEIGQYIVKKELGLSQKYNKFGEKMYELCKDMELKHEPFFNSIMTRLSINSDNIEEVSKSVMLEILDEDCNNGRIVSMYTFCMVLAVNCYNDATLSNKVDSIIKITADIVLENQEWFDRNNNWDGFVNFFTKPTEKLWTGFMWTTVGLGAVAGFLYANS